MQNPQMYKEKVKIKMSSRTTADQCRYVDGMISIEDHLTLYLESTREVVLGGRQNGRFLNKPFPAWTVTISC